MFSTKGYHGTGIKEIVDALGIPKGSFYNYFKSKEAFAAEIIRHYSHILDEHWESYIAEGSSYAPAEMLQNAFEKMISNQESVENPSGCLIGNLAGELAESSEICRETLNQVKKNWCDRIAFHLKHGQETGEIRDDLGSSELAGFCWDVWEGALLRMKLEKSTDSIRKTMTMLFKSFLIIKKIDMENK